MYKGCFVSNSIMYCQSTRQVIQHWSCAIRGDQSIYNHNEKRKRKNKQNKTEQKNQRIRKKDISSLKTFYWHCYFMAHRPWISGFNVIYWTSYAPLVTNSLNSWVKQDVFGQTLSAGETDVWPQGHGHNVVIDYVHWMCLTNEIRIYNMNM